MAVYEKRPERETTVEAFRVGDEPPEWFTGDRWTRWSPVPDWAARGRGPVRYVIRKWQPFAREREWLDALDGSYVVYNGPEEEFTLLSAARFEWLYRAPGLCLENTSEGPTEIDAPA